MQAAAKIDSKISSQQLPHVKSTETVQGPNHRTGERVYQKRVLSYIQLFREELSEKSARDNPERYCGWFLFHFCSKKSERRAREAMDVCLWVLKESNKSTFEGYCVRNSVLIISHVTFRDCRVHIFSDNLSRNSCILKQWNNWAQKWWFLKYLQFWRAMTERSRSSLFLADK